MPEIAHKFLEDLNGKPVGIGVGSFPPFPSIAIHSILVYNANEAYSCYNELL